MLRNKLLLIVFLRLFLNIQFLYASDVDSPTQIANQVSMITSLSQQIQMLNDQIQKLDEQVNAVREQIDFAKKINDGTEQFPLISDLRDLYASVLDLQDGITATITDIQALNSEVRSYFTGEADFSIDPRYAHLQVGENTALIKLAKAKEMQAEAQKAKEISEKLAGQPIEGMGVKEREEMMIKSLVNTLDILTRVMEKIAIGLEGDAVQQLEEVSQAQREELEKGEMFNQVNIWAQEIPSNIFYTPTGIFSQQ